LILAVACVPDATAPQPLFEGVWTSPTGGPLYQDVQVNITFDDGAYIVGSYSMRMVGCTAPQGGCLWSGPLANGVRDGEKVVLPFAAPFDCPVTFGYVSATLTAPNTMSGFFVGTNCGGSKDAPAAITLTRQ
jgi:hypothetical protein